LGVDLCPCHLCLYLDSFPALSLVHERNATQVTPPNPKWTNRRVFPKISYFLSLPWRTLLRLCLHWLASADFSALSSLC
jgi:hypothetical protein